MPPGLRTRYISPRTRRGIPDDDWRASSRQQYKMSNVFSGQTSPLKMLPPWKAVKPGHWVEILTSVASIFAFGKTSVEMSIAMTVPSLAYLVRPGVNVPGPLPTTRTRLVFLMCGSRNAACVSAVLNKWFRLCSLNDPVCACLSQFLSPSLSTLVHCWQHMG